MYCLQVIIILYALGLGQRDLIRLLGYSVDDRWVGKQFKTKSKYNHVMAKHLLSCIIVYNSYCTWFILSAPDVTSWFLWLAIVHRIQMLIWSVWQKISNSSLCIGQIISSSCSVASIKQCLSPLKTFSCCWKWLWQREFRHTRQDLMALYFMPVQTLHSTSPGPASEWETWAGRGAGWSSVLFSFSTISATTTFFPKTGLGVKVCLHWGQLYCLPWASQWRLIQSIQ